MISIASDLPKELLELAKKIDFSRVPKQQVATKIEQIKQLVIRYNIPKRVGKAIPIQLELQGCPQELATLISGLDFSKYGSITKKIAIGYIEAYLYKNGLLK